MAWTEGNNQVPRGGRPIDPNAVPRSPAPGGVDANGDVVPGGMGAALTGGALPPNTYHPPGYHPPVPRGPAGPAVATAGDSAYEANRGNLIDWLTQRAQGQGPSLAEEQIRQGLAREQASQYGQAAAASPAQRAIAMRTAMQNAGAIGAGAAQQGGLGRIAEQQAAQGTLAQVLQGAIGQQNQQGQFNAGAQNQAAQMAYEAALRQAMQKAQLGSAWDIAKLGSSTQLQINQNNQPSWWDRLSGLVGSALPVVGGMLGGPLGAAAGGALGSGLGSVFGSKGGGMGSALSGAPNMGGSLGYGSTGTGGYGSLPSF